MKIEIKGMADVQRALTKVAPNQARNLMRATIHSIASDIAKEAKKLAPVDSGDLRKGIKAKRRKAQKDVFQSDVIIQQKEDEKSIFYWRFVENGTGGSNPQPGRPFIRPAFQRVEANIKDIFVKNFGKKLEALVRREAKKAAK